jgi:hypothetical protein
MKQTERFSLATHLYVRLRRNSGRVVDAVQMARNDDYARQVLQLVKNDPDPQMQRLASQFGELLGNSRPPSRPTSETAASWEPRAAGAATQNYVGALR